MQNHIYRFTGPDAEARRDSVFETMIKDAQFINVKKDVALEDGENTFMIHYQENNPLEHITDLLSEVDKFDQEMFPVPYELHPGDRVVGELPIWLRKVFALSRFYSREAKRLAVENEYENHDIVSCSRVQELTARHDLLEGILWYGCRTYFHLFHSAQVGVRKGWQCVESSPKPPDLRAFLGSIGFPPEE